MEEAGEILSQWVLGNVYMLLGWAESSETPKSLALAEKML
jgi:hypothetical protein